MTEELRLDQAAMEYLGVKFRHRGRTTRGLDCLGLVVLAARDCGYEAKDKKVYGRQPFNDGLRQGLIDNGCVPVTREMRPGDILLMKHYLHDKEPTHVGIVTEHPHGLGIIHSYAAMGRVVYHRIDKVRKRKVMEVFEWHVKH